MPSISFTSDATTTPKYTPNKAKSKAGHVKFKMAAPQQIRKITEKWIENAAIAKYTTNRVKLYYLDGRTPH